MPAPLRHVAINADDVPRAKAFYESVFGWSLNPWGPPGFYNTADAGPGVYLALQGRRELIPGVRTNGLEVTFGVEDLAAVITAVEAAGCRILMPRVRLEGVGDLMYFEDPEGNIVGVMQYDEGRWT